MSAKATLLKSGASCLVLIFIVCIIRIYNCNPASSFTTTVDSAVLAVLHPNTSSSTKTLRYHLIVNISFRNGQQMRCRDFVATAFYNDSMLGVPENWIPTGDDSAWGHGAAWSSTTFQGTVVVYPSVAAKLERERAEGTVHVVRVRVSAAVQLFIFPGYPSSIVDDLNDFDCWLWFQPPRDAAPAVFGEGTKCWPVK